ncbi:MAG: hypothetical protein R3315_10170 [Woeseiaceae bacterium]|nr:hypothetical protein [Woeseiaceae bacterium]
MADRLKDAEDRALEALFAAPPIADDGFSKRVVARVRRRMWLRRLALPVAFAVGAAIAAEPALAVLAALGNAVSLLPVEVLPLPRIADVSQISSWLVVSGVAIGAMLLLPALDD